MAYSTRAVDYDEEELRRVAELHFVRRISAARIEKEFNIRPRQRVDAMCKAALDAGLVKIAIMPSEKAREGRLRGLEQQIRERFRDRGMLECILVNGRESMVREKLPDNIGQIIVDNMAHKAAEEIERRFERMEKPCLAVSYGFVARKVADSLRPQWANMKNEGYVISAQGMRRHELDRFDANDIVRDIARQFGCHYACMLIPAVVPADAAPYVREMLLVKGFLDRLHNDTNIVFSALSGLHQTDWQPLQDSIQNDLFSRKDFSKIVAQQGVGNLGGWWFNIEGESVTPEGKEVIGLGLDKLRGMVKEKMPVILATGADASRIPALAVALGCRKPLANVWVGDEVTAKVLLGEPLADPRIPWKPWERKILHGLRSGLPLDDIFHEKI